MTDSGQVASSAAEVYEAFFLPALFAAWPAHLIEAAQIEAGAHVVDVACGTGVLARAAAEVVGSEGKRRGCRPQSGMIAVARRKGPGLQWHEAPAESLPLASASVDAVVSQFGLMFFSDREKALQEMWRVLRPGGRLAIAVWDAIEHTPGYAAVTALLARLFGDDVADLLRAPYAMGDPIAVRDLLVRAGIPSPGVKRVPGEARFPSIRSWMHTDVRGWTLAEVIDDAGFERLVREAERELAHLVSPDGTVRFDHPGLIATARKA